MVARDLTGVRVPLRPWVGLVAAVASVTVIAGIGNVISALFPTDEPALDFAIGHATLPFVVIAGVLFVRWAGWSREVWRPMPAEGEHSPRWMLAVPVLLLVVPVLSLASTPWGERSAAYVVVAAVGCVLIGFSEELFFRGILVASIREHHGETLALIVSALLFGLAHSVGSALHSVPVAYIAFQVFGTAFDGALYYIALRATGRLWVPIALHALTDFGLYAQSGGTDADTGHGTDLTGYAVGPELAQGVSSIVFLVWCIRVDSRRRRLRRQQADATAAEQRADSPT